MVNVCPSSHSDKNIKEFMTYYRETFPQATVLPKMHLLERHVVPWLEKFGVGLGLMGEQGAESIHAAINKAYTNIPDTTKRLNCILQEHHRQVCPILQNEVPDIKRRKLDKDRNED